MLQDMELWSKIRRLLVPYSPDGGDVVVEGRDDKEQGCAGFHTNLFGNGHSGASRSPEEWLAACFPARTTIRGVRLNDNFAGFRTSLLWTILLVAARIFGWWLLEWRSGTTLRLQSVASTTE